MINIKEFKEQFGRQALSELAKEVGSSVEYFDLLVAGKRKTGVVGGKNLTGKLVEARPEIFSKRSLRPDVYS